MRRFLKMMGASLKMTYREKVAIFWLFLFPVILMLLLGAIFGHSGSANINLGIVDLDNSQVSRAITQAIGGVKAFKINKGTQKDELKRLTDGKNNAVLIIDKGFLTQITQGKPGVTRVYVDKTNPSTSEITYSAISQVIDGVRQEMAVRLGMPVTPDLITVQRKSVTSTELGYLDFIVPGILALTIMQAGVIGLSLNLVMVREKGILRRIKVSPVPLTRYLGSEITATLLISIIQALMLLLVGWLVFKIHIRGNPVYILAMIIIGSLAFLALGFLIASVARTIKTAQIASNVVSFPMMFLAGVFFPLAILPNFLAVIAKCLPLYYLGDGLRKVMIMGKGLGAVWVDILVLVVFGAICFLLSLKLFKWE
jgi:ABC-2 type transport system permease protein